MLNQIEIKNTLRTITTVLSEIRGPRPRSPLRFKWVTAPNRPEHQNTGTLSSNPVQSTRFHIEFVLVAPSTQRTDLNGLLYTHKSGGGGTPSVYNHGTLLDAHAHHGAAVVARLPRRTLLWSVLRRVLLLHHGAVRGIRQRRRPVRVHLMVASGVRVTGGRRVALHRPAPEARRLVHVVLPARPSDQV